MCGGGGGKVPNSALWMYNKLMHCRYVALIDHNKSKHFKATKSQDIQYLNSLCNESQYLAARCAMSENVYMYHCSSPGAVEYMNRANNKMSAWTAIDLPNATILLLKLECTRFNKMKQEAWGGISIPTPRGKAKYDATFTNLILSTSFIICVMKMTIGSVESATIARLLPLRLDKRLF
jgi:hypothetical protein